MNGEGEVESPGIQSDAIRKAFLHSWGKVWMGVVRLLPAMVFFARYCAKQKPYPLRICHCWQL